jgi:hypothetical protein
MRTGVEQFGDRQNEQVQMMEELETIHGQHSEPVSTCLLQAILRRK